MKEAWINLIQWRSASWSGVKSHLLRGFMLFGVCPVPIDHAEGTLWSLFSGRLCITTPSSTGPKLALDERIFKLSQNKGNYLQSLFQIQTHYDNSTDHCRLHQVRRFYVGAGGGCSEQSGISRKRIQRKIRLFLRDVNQQRSSAIHGRSEYVQFLRCFY